MQSNSLLQRDFKPYIVFASTLFMKLFNPDAAFMTFLAGKGLQLCNTSMVTHHLPSSPDKHMKPRVLSRSPFISL